MAEEEAKEAPADSGAGDAKPKKKLPGKIIVLGMVLPLLLLGGGGAYFMGVFGGDKKEMSEAEKKKMAEEARKKSMVYFQLPDMLVNLNTTGRKVHYLKISVSLELEKQEDVRVLQTAMPRIVDNFQVYLRELRVEDLRGSAGLYRLREELLARVNKAAAPAKVNDVLFKEMLIQ